MSNTVKLHKPTSSSTLIDSSEKNIITIKVTWGGGMGGASKDLYGEIVGEDSMFYTFKTIKGEPIKIGKNYIVMMEDKVLSISKYKDRNQIETLYRVIHENYTNAKVAYVDKTVDGGLEWAKTIYSTTEAA